MRRNEEYKNRELLQLVVKVKEMLFVERVSHEKKLLSVNIAAKKKSHLRQLVFCIQEY